MKSATKYPKLPSTVGKRATVRFPDGRKMIWHVIDEIRHNEGSGKILILQRLQSDNDQTTEMFRFGYYIIGKKPKMKGRWVWGQFAPFIYADDFKAMILEATKKNWIKLNSEQKP